MGQRGDHWDGSGVRVRERKGTTRAAEGEHFWQMKEERASWDAPIAFWRADNIRQARAWFERFCCSPGIADVRRSTVIRHVKTLLKEIPE